MIAEKVIGNLAEIKPSVEIDTVKLDWFEAEKNESAKPPQVDVILELP